jgi:serine protease Do
VTSEIANAMKLGRPQGVLLKTVYPGGPAAQAGLHTGDVIVAIDNGDVDDMQSLNYRIATHRAGESVKAKVFSGGHWREVTLRLSLPPESPRRDTTTIGGRNPLTGARVENLSPAVALDLQINLFAKGVVIRAVGGGFAGQYGFQPGDIVRSINGRAVNDVNSLKRMLDGTRHWDLVIDRGGRRLSLTVDG